MNSAGLLKSLEGSSVSSVRLTAEDLIIEMENGWTLKAFNRVYINGGDFYVPSGLIGDNLVEVSKDQSGVILKFERSGCILIGGSDDDFLGPEMLHLFSPSGETYIDQD